MGNFKINYIPTNLISPYKNTLQNYNYTSVYVINVISVTVQHYNVYYQLFFVTLGHYSKTLNCLQIAMLIMNYRVIVNNI